jgi:hypothetical protein
VGGKLRGGEAKSTGGCGAVLKRIAVAKLIRMFYASWWRKGRRDDGMLCNNR